MDERAAALEQAGRTVVVVGNERHVCGLIAVADAVRPEARARSATCGRSASSTWSC